MSKSQKSEIREPLIHLSKRSSISAGKAWAIRIIAVILGLLYRPRLYEHIIFKGISYKPGKNTGFLYDIPA